MFDGLKHILAGAANQSAQPRSLTSPEQLQIGDIVTFQLLDQPELSGKRFQVTAVTTLDFEHNVYPVFALQGENPDALIFLSVHTKGGISTLAIRKKITHDEVDGIFGLDNFADVFEEGSLTLKANPIDSLKSWLAPSYYKAVDCRSGYHHIGDYRTEALPEYEDDSPGIDYYQLLDNSEKFAVEIEVGDEDESDVYVTITTPLAAIAEMWPA